MSTDPPSDPAGERISRYVIEKNKMVPSENRVRHTLFMPPPNRRLSVFRTDGLEDAEIWQIGRDVVAVPRGKTLYGRGDFTEGDVTAAKLSIVPDTAVHPKHANLEGWPDDDAQVEQVALNLAQATKLVRVPPAPPASEKPASKAPEA